jgi:hypothetical protein
MELGAKIYLLWPPAGEPEPTIERSRATFTATTGFDANCVRHLLDNVTKTNRLVGDESRKMHVDTRAFILVTLGILGLFLVHNI